MTRKKNAKNTARPGRPKGSGNVETDCVHVEASRCKQCGSTEREGYSRRLVREIAGERDGVPYDRVVWRWTKCRACGQARVDITCEMAGGQRTA